MHLHLASDRLTDSAERRWAIAHELGHLVMGHPSPPAAELCAPRPRCGLPHRRDIEDEADAFATSLLMPAPLVSPWCDTLAMTLDGTVHLARSCVVPLVAAALRCTETSIRVCAAALSRDGIIEWSAPSLRFLLQHGSAALSTGRRVGPDALVMRYAASGALPDAAQLVPAAAWFDGCGRGAELQEHSMVIDGTQSTLTMLWAPDEAPTQRQRALSLRRTALARDWVLNQLQLSGHPSHLPATTSRGGRMARHARSLIASARSDQTAATPLSDDTLREIQVDERTRRQRRA